MIKYAAVGKAKKSDSEDIYVEFESANRKHATDHIIKNFDSKFTWFFMKKPTGKIIKPRVEIVEW